MLRNLALLFVTLVAACAGTARSDVAVALAGTPTQVGFRDYRTGAHLLIVNDSQLAARGAEGSTPEQRRAEFYSQTRSEAMTKVATDEVMDALLEYFEEVGLEKGASSGFAPQGSGQATQSIEVRSGTRTYHVLGRKGMPAEEARAFRDSVVAFNQIYNSIYQLQSVEAQPGEQVFKTPAAPKRRQ